MTTSTTRKNKIPFWSVLIWLILWQILAMCLKSDILLVSPVKTVICLAGLIFEADFWKAIGFTFLRICLGFLSAVIFGVFLGALSYKSKAARGFLSLPVAVIKSTPVASFIILVLIWVSSENLSVIISFLMTFPIIYTNICEGLSSMDKKLLSMAKVFKIPFKGRLRYIYIPEVIPFFIPACSLALGLSFKSGIAAEIIGLPRGSIGERLYEAKIYLNTPELFAWTAVIILISILFEKAVMFFINRLLLKIEGR